MMASSNMLTTTAICAISVLACVSLHLGALFFLWKIVLPRLKRLTHVALGILVCIAIVAHLVEIGVFAIAHVVLGEAPPAEGILAAGAMDESTPLYDSASAYTSLGTQQPPTGGLRVLTAVEALTGLVLITWTASFLFLIMQRTWGK
jgi:hypothetical protein